MSSPAFVPAILTDSFDELKQQIARLDKFFDTIHIDILDDTLVPGLTFDDVERVRLIPTTAQLELHFMVHEPAKHIPHWETVSHVARVIFHAEATGNLAKAKESAREKGWQVGIAINPETPLSTLNPHLADVDIVQFMTVHPGMQGAAFVPEVVAKITAFTKQKPRPRCSVDGAVSDKTIKQLRDAGVDQCVVGSYFIKATDVAKNLTSLQQ